MTNSTTLTPNHDTKFWIHPDDFQKVINYAKASYDEFSSEIAGQLIVVKDDDGDYILQEPVIMKQTVSGGECNLDAGELAKYYSKNANKYGDNIRFCWWHSHHTMKAFWSGTDDSTILSNPSKDWTLSLVVNLKKEYKLRIQFFEPFLHEVNVELNMITVESEDNDAIIEEVKEKCTKEHVTMPTYGKTYQQSVFGFNDYYGAEGQGHYNSFTNRTFNKIGIPKKIMDEAELALDGLLEEISDIIDGEEGLSIYNDKAKDYNKKYQKYNFKIVSFTNANALEKAILAYWPEDFFENIKKGAIA